MKGAIERALELVEQTPNSWMPQQFENPANIDVHVRTTAQEIATDFADAPLDALITGVGTGGHITGVAQVLKSLWPHLKVYAVEPTLRSEEHTSELQSLMRSSYAVFCLKKKKQHND